jgi:ketosteroid isomerase-like protein
LIPEPIIAVERRSIKRVFLGVISHEEELMNLSLLSILSLSLTATSPTEDAAAVEAALAAMWDAVERGDIEAYQSHIHPEFSAFGENDVYLAEGKTREVTGMADYMKRATGVHTEMHQSKVTVRGDVAWITYYWTDSGTIGGERFTSRGKSTRIFVRENGKWLCIHGHYTAVP